MSGTWHWKESCVRQGKATRRTSDCLKHADALVGLVLIQVQMRGQPNSTHAELKQCYGFPGAYESSAVRARFIDDDLFGIFYSTVNNFPEASRYHTVTYSCLSHSLRL
jgi:hypothetical protein